MANTQFEVILGMLFLKISNANISFGKKTLTWKSCTTNKALSTTKWVQQVNLKKFVIAALDADSKTFVMHVTIREREEILVHSESQAQIGALLFNKALTKVLVEYSDYSNIFSVKNAAELSENNRMNEYAIELEDVKQPLFRPIYSLGPVELKTLKIYIESNLANCFIRLSMFPTGALIFFDQKQDGSLCFCIDYWSINNMTIKNRYLLSLIGESLDRLSWVRRFTQLDLTNFYY